MSTGPSGLLGITNDDSDPLSGGRPSLQLVSFLCRDEVIWWGRGKTELRRMREEKGKKLSCLHPLWKNRNIFATYLVYYFF